VSFCLILDADDEKRRDFLLILANLALQLLFTIASNPRVIGRESFAETLSKSCL
jgi:hypothetical protein